MTHEPTHLDLFSGIGGFAVASGWAGFRTVGFCEIDPYCREVLKKHWPRVPVHGDIRGIRGEDYKGVSLLTGGFPCQPFSVAGKQRGTADDRHLWPEMLRIIREARPRWIVGENVAHIVNMALDQVHIDLEGEDYEVESVIIPAIALDAPHRRDRVWIMAHSRREGQGGNQRVGETGAKGVSGGHPAERGSQVAWSDMAHPEGFAGQGGQQPEKPWEREFGGGYRWCAEPGLGRVADGIPHRSHRLKALGNAVVPQVPYEILRHIRRIMDSA
ncbi:DNA (cytosine-5-)-methyltransferase [bacterium]|nr:DNA (cytosine-5-)-methyltransferase [bacterium]